MEKSFNSFHKYTSPKFSCPYPCSNLNRVKLGKKGIDHGCANSLCVEEKNREPTPRFSSAHREKSHFCWQHFLSHLGFHKRFSPELKYFVSTLINRHLRKCSVPWNVTMFKKNSFKLWIANKVFEVWQVL